MCCATGAKGSAAQQLPLGALLRFVVQMNASSDASASYATAARARALFLGGARGSSGFAERVSNSAGVDVPGLPFFAAAPVRHCGSVVNQKRVHIELVNSHGQIKTSLGRLGLPHYV